MFIAARLQLAALCGCFFLSGAGAAETFVLQSDEVIEGKITRSTNNTVLIMLENGAILPASLGDIVEVRIRAEGEGEIAGRLISWENGVYEVDSSKYILRIASGRILSVGEAASGFGGPIVDEPSLLENEPETAPSAPVQPAAPELQEPAAPSATM